MTLEERIAALEAQAAANQLPASMAVLKRKLEQDWQPDASVLLQAGSITTEAIADGTITTADLATPEAMRYVGAAGQPAFSGAWVNFDGGSPPPAGTGRHAGFWKDNQGVVRLTGAIKTGVSGTSAFTLPAGYTPGSTGHECPAVASGGIAEVQITSAGLVLPFNVGASAVTTIVFLDGVSFRATY